MCIKFIVQYVFNIGNHVIKSFHVFLVSRCQRGNKSCAPVELQPMCLECRGTVTVKLTAYGDSELRRCIGATQVDRAREKVTSDIELRSRNGQHHSAVASSCYGYSEKLWLKRGKVTQSELSLPVMNLMDTYCLNAQGLINS